MNKPNPLLDRLRHHVTGAIERGEGVAIVEQPPVPMCSLLSIDAWRADGTWTWNNWHRLQYVPVTLADLHPRALLQWLRENGTLSQASRGQLCIEDDGYNVVVMLRGTREPLYAIAYGEVQS